MSIVDGSYNFTPSDGGRPGQLTVRGGVVKEADAWLSKYMFKRAGNLPGTLDFHHRAVGGVPSYIRGQLPPADKR